MTELVVIISCVAAFLIGFLWGTVHTPKEKIAKTVVKDNEELKRLKEEYSNFLNYDGTEQP